MKEQDDVFEQLLIPVGTLGTQLAETLPIKSGWSAVSCAGTCIKHAKQAEWDETLIITGAHAATELGSNYLLETTVKGMLGSLGVPVLAALALADILAVANEITPADEMLRHAEGNLVKTLASSGPYTLSCALAVQRLMWTEQQAFIMNNASRFVKWKSSSWQSLIDINVKHGNSLFSQFLMHGLGLKNNINSWSQTVEEKWLQLGIKRFNGFSATLVSSFESQSVQLETNDSFNAVLSELDNLGIIGVQLALLAGEPEIAEQRFLTTQAGLDLFSRMREMQNAKVSLDPNKINFLKSFNPFEIYQNKLLPSKFNLDYDSAIMRSLHQAKESTSKIDFLYLAASELSRETIYQIPRENDLINSQVENGLFFTQYHDSSFEDFFLFSSPLSVNPSLQLANEIYQVFHDDESMDERALTEALEKKIHAEINKKTQEAMQLQEASLPDFSIAELTQTLNVGSQIAVLIGNQGLAKGLSTASSITHGLDRSKQFILQGDPNSALLVVLGTGLSVVGSNIASKPQDSIVPFMEVLPQLLSCLSRQVSAIEKGMVHNFEQIAKNMQQQHQEFKALFTTIFYEQDATNSLLEQLHQQQAIAQERTQGWYRSETQQSFNRAVVKAQFAKELTEEEYGSILLVIKKYVFNHAIQLADDSYLQPDLPGASINYFNRRLYQKQLEKLPDPVMLAEGLKLLNYLSEKYQLSPPKDLVQQFSRASENINIALTRFRGSNYINQLIEQMQDFLTEFEEENLVSIESLDNYHQLGQQLNHFVALALHPGYRELKPLLLEFLEKYSGLSVKRLKLISKEQRSTLLTVSKQNLLTLSAELNKLSTACLKISSNLSGLAFLDVIKSQFDRVHSVRRPDKSTEETPKTKVLTGAFSQEARDCLKLLQHDLIENKLDKTSAPWILEGNYHSSTAANKIQLAHFHYQGRNILTVGVLATISRRKGQLSIRLSSSEQRQKTLDFLEQLPESVKTNCLLTGYSGGGGLAVSLAAELGWEAITFDAIGSHWPTSISSKFKCTNYIVEENLLNCQDDTLLQYTYKQGYPDKKRAEQLLTHTAATVFSKLPQDFAQILTTHCFALFYGIAYEELTMNTASRALLANHTIDEQIELMQILIHGYGSNDSGYEYFPQSIPELAFSEKQELPLNVLMDWAKAAQSTRGELTENAQFLFQVIESLPVQDTKRSVPIMTDFESPEAYYLATLRDQGYQQATTPLSFAAQLEKVREVSIDERLQWAQSLYIGLYSSLAWEQLTGVETKTHYWPTEILGRRRVHSPSLRLKQLSPRWIIEKAAQENRQPEMYLWAISSLIKQTVQQQSFDLKVWDVSNIYFDEREKPLLPTKSVYQWYRDKIEKDDNLEIHFLETLEKYLSTNSNSDEPARELEARALRFKQASQVSGVAQRQYMAGILQSLGTTALSIASGALAGAAIGTALSVASFGFGVLVAVFMVKSSRKQGKAFQQIMHRIIDDIIILSKQLVDFEENMNHYFEFMYELGQEMHVEQMLLANLDLTRMEDITASLRYLYEKGLVQALNEQTQWQEWLMRDLTALKTEPFSNFAKSIESIALYVDKLAHELQIDHTSNDVLLYESNPGLVTESIIGQAIQRIEQEEGIYLARSALPNLEAFADAVASYVNLRELSYRADASWGAFDHQAFVAKIKSVYDETKQTLNAISRSSSAYTSLIAQIKIQIAKVKEEVAIAEAKYRRDTLGRNLEHYFNGLREKIEGQHNKSDFDVFIGQLSKSQIQFNLKMDEYRKNKTNSFLNEFTSVWQEKLNFWSVFNRRISSFKSWNEMFSDIDMLDYTSYSNEDHEQIYGTIIYSEPSMLPLIILLKNNLKIETTSKSNSMQMQILEWMNLADGPYHSCTYAGKPVSCGTTNNEHLVKTELSLIAEVSNLKFRILEHKMNGKYAPMKFLSYQESSEGEDYVKNEINKTFVEKRITLPEELASMIPDLINQYNLELLMKIKEEVMVGKPLGQSIVELNKSTTELHHLVYLTLNSAYQDNQQLFLQLLPSLSGISSVALNDFLSRPGVTPNNFATFFEYYSSHVEAIENSILFALKTPGNVNLSSFRSLDLALGHLQHWENLSHQRSLPILIPVAKTVLEELQDELQNLQDELQSKAKNRSELSLQFSFIYRTLETKSQMISEEDCRALLFEIDEVKDSLIPEDWSNFMRKFNQRMGISSSQATTDDYFELDRGLVVNHDCETDYEDWLLEQAEEQDPILSTLQEKLEQIDSQELTLKNHRSRTMKWKTLARSIENTIESLTEEERAGQCESFPEKIGEESLDLVEECEQSYQSWKARHSSRFFSAIEEHLEEKLDEPSREQSLKNSSGVLSFSGFFYQVSESLSQQLTGTYTNFCQAVLGAKK